MKKICHMCILGAMLLLQSANADLIRSTVSIHAGVDSVLAGTTFPIALRITVPDGWYTYAANPGDAGMPPDIRFSAPEGVEIGEWQFPPYETFTDSVGTYYGYRKEVVLLNQISIPDDVPPDVSFKAVFNVVWMICKDMCLPFQNRLTLTLPQATEGDEPTEVEGWSELLRSGGWAVKECAE